MKPIRDMIVATDLQRSSEAAVAAATRIAAAVGAKLHVVHVIESVPEPTKFPFPEHLVAPIRAELEELARGIREQGVDAAALLVAGRPADEIVSAARAIGASLTVVGTHGHQGLGRWALGSVAEGVARHAATPVMTVRSA
jgi:nucleotide-binding universal stress UspA family protein